MISQPYKDDFKLELDKRILEMVHIYGAQKWKRISKELNCSKNASYIRDRYYSNILTGNKPKIFTYDENKIILKFIENNGTKWNKLAHEIQNCSQRQLKNYFHSSLKRRQFIEDPESCEKYPKVLSLILQQSYGLSQNELEYLKNLQQNSINKQELPDNFLIKKKVHTSKKKDDLNEINNKSIIYQDQEQPKSTLHNITSSFRLLPNQNYPQPFKERNGVVLSSQNIIELNQINQDQHAFLTLAQQLGSIIELQKLSYSIFSNISNFACNYQPNINNNCFPDSLFQNPFYGRQFINYSQHSQFL